jgi:hypothetical protein
VRLRPEVRIPAESEALEDLVPGAALGQQLQQLDQRHRVATRDVAEHATPLRWPGERRQHDVGTARACVADHRVQRSCDALAQLFRDRDAIARRTAVHRRHLRGGDLRRRGLAQDAFERAPSEREQRAARPLLPRARRRQIDVLGTLDQVARASREQGRVVVVVARHEDHHVGCVRERHAPQHDQLLQRVVAAHREVLDLHRSTERGGELASQDLAHGGGEVDAEAERVRVPDQRHARGAGLLSQGPRPAAEPQRIGPQVRPERPRVEVRHQRVADTCQE